MTPITIFQSGRVAHLWWCQFTFFRLGGNQPGDDIFPLTIQSTLCVQGPAIIWDKPTTLALAQILFAISVLRFFHEFPHHLELRIFRRGTVKKTPCACQQNMCLIISYYLSRVLYKQQRLCERLSLTYKVAICTLSSSGDRQWDFWGNLQKMQLKFYASG